MSEARPVEQQPVLYVFAGPNGAGKSTLFNAMAARSSSVEQVNGDVLKQQNPQLNGFDVESMTAQRIKELRDSRVSFSVESNLAQTNDYKLIHGAKAAGYRVELVYVSLESVRECQDRVLSRVAKGGHDVPPAIIEQRYHQSLSLLKQNYKEFDRIELIDNTSRPFQPGALIEKGLIAPLQSPPPEWVRGVVTHVQRMERVNQLLAQPAADMQQATIRVTEAARAPGARGQAEAVQAAVRMSGAQVSDVQPAAASEQGQRVSYLNVQYSLKSPELERISTTLDAVHRQSGSEVMESAKDQQRRWVPGQAREAGQSQATERGQDQQER
ncbi:zeta toxin family protein [Hymenobacter psychrophilus]|nr:zeta toxin family protein [Hymenobacter psychrophilus]